jgi:hypothetical protein
VTIIEVSEELVTWAARAGYGRSAEDGSSASIFWTNPGGELRYYIREAGDGWNVLTFATRSSPEQFELATVSMPILEKYLYSLFGADIRQQSGLRRLTIGTKRDFIADDCALSELDGEGYRTLLYRDDPVARATDPVSSVSKLTKLSQLLAVSIEEIEAAYLSEDGAPLFHA